MSDLVVLDESDVLGALAEALTAHVDLVLSDDGTLVSTHTASAGTTGSQSLLGVSVEESLTGHDYKSVRREEWVHSNAKNERRNGKK
jgi:hypothetical protein